MRAREPAGRRISGKYRLGQVLATGGMGVVHAGVHLVTGRAVAIKRLRSELVSEPDIVRRVSREAALAVDASHPNVVEVLDAGADECGVPYLVLERLYGQTLEALLDEPLPLLTTARALLPVVNAVAALHRIGIVHRDIKPSNIFLHRAPEGRVTPKLLDFGIAKALARSGATLTRATLGTPAYMAPERSLGYHAGGAAADVWSMGLVFVRCLTGRLPFEHAVGESVTLRSGLRSERLPGVHEAIAAVLARALAFEPVERPADMTTFRDELLRALATVDAGARWPDQETVSYAPSEFVLPSSTELDAPLVAPAVLGAARPQGIDTRTLMNAARAMRALRTWPRARSRALLVSGAVAAAVALVAANGNDRPSETSAESRHVASSTAPRETAALPARMDAQHAAPRTVVDPAPESRVPPTSAAASPAVASPRDVAVAASPVPSPPHPASGSAAREPRKPTPIAAYSPAGHGTASTGGEVAPEFRVGANRAPIIE